MKDDTYYEDCIYYDSDDCNHVCEGCADFSSVAEDDGGEEKEWDDPDKDDDWEDEDGENPEDWDEEDLDYETEEDAEYEDESELM